MVSGFSIIKNGEIYGYPFCEALLSLAPFVDELVVAHGDSHDNTAELLESLRSKISCNLRIIDSPWNSKNIQFGTELARQSNIALEACENDICFYIQADEVIADHNSNQLKEDLQRFSKDDTVDALALHWVHFYGNYQTIVESRKWYRREMRIIKKSKKLKSYGDAQGFRIYQNENHWTKPHAALSRAQIYHYGWVRPPQVMAQKSEALDRLWHGNQRDGTHSAENIFSKQYGLKPFTGKHPDIMKDRILASEKEDPIHFSGKISLKNKLRLGLTDFIEKKSGWRPGEFTNYSSLKKY